MYLQQFSRVLNIAAFCAGLAFFPGCLAELGLIPGQDADTEIAQLSLYYIFLNQARVAGGDCRLGDVSFNKIGGTGTLTCGGDSIQSTGKVGLISSINSANLLSMGFTMNLSENGTLELIGGAQNSENNIDFGHGFRFSTAASTARGLNNSGTLASPKNLPANPTAGQDFSICFDIELNESFPQMKGNIPGSCSAPDTGVNYFDSQAVTALANDENDAGGRRAWGMILSDVRVFSLILNETRKYPN